MEFKDQATTEDILGPLAAIATSYQRHCTRSCCMPATPALRWNRFASLRSSFDTAGAKWPHPLPLDKFSEAHLVLLHNGSEGLNLLGPKFMGQSVRCLRWILGTTLTPRAERTPSSQCSQKTCKAEILAIF